MKILIAYDGSSCAEAALDDLTRAGLPAAGEFLVVSVAEVWLPPENLAENPEAKPEDDYLQTISRTHYERNKQEIAEFEILANHAVQRLQIMFPGWRARAIARAGSPAWEVLTAADRFKPDLIVAGSQGRSAVGRFFLGSISHKILTEARCSVRVARSSNRAASDQTAARIVIGFDHLPGAAAAVAAVAARNWTAKSAVRLVSVSDPITPSLIARFVPPINDLIDEVNQDERERLQTLAQPMLEKLRAAGLSAELIIQAGNPKQILIEEATRWNADTIFVGANRYGSRIERFLLGSVSAAIAARAACSVEIVRTQQ